MIEAVIDCILLRLSNAIRCAETREASRKANAAEAAIPTEALERWTKFERIWDWPATECRSVARGVFLALTPKEMERAIHVAPLYLKVARDRNSRPARTATWLSSKCWREHLRSDAPAPVELSNLAPKLDHTCPIMFDGSRDQEKAGIPAPRCGAGE